MQNNRISSLPRPFILTAFDTMQQTRDEAYPFTQEANFYWLTHINEAGWLVIGDEGEGKSGGQLHLMAPDRTDIQRLFEGGLSHAEATALSGIPSVLTQAEGEAYIQRLAKKHKKVYSLGRDPYDSYNTFTRNPAPERLRRTLRKYFKQVGDIRPELTTLRAQKQPGEIAEIRQAIAITQQAFEEVRHRLKTYTYEYEIEADMTRTIRRQGAAGHAYEPIVASGKNALVMHYAENNAKLVPGTVVLMDVGAQYGAFAADITRTYAYGGADNVEVSARTRAVHEALVAAHKAIISCITPGLFFADYQKQSDAIMKDALMKLGLLDDAADNKTYRKYFPHAISHGLGIDVHESLGGDQFKPGMVVTVEPGIYIPEEAIGIRVEDDILVTETGNENLSKSLSLEL